jgi:hypothetical protein
VAKAISILNIIYISQLKLTGINQKRSYIKFRQLKKTVIDIGNLLQSVLTD